MSASSAIVFLLLFDMNIIFPIISNQIVFNITFKNIAVISWWTKLEYINKLPKVIDEFYQTPRLYQVHLIIGESWTQNFSCDRQRFSDYIEIDINLNTVTKDYKIGICSFSAKPSIKGYSKDWLAWNQDYVSE